MGIPGEVVGALLSKTQLVEGDEKEEEEGKQDDEVGSDGLRHYHKHSTKRSVGYILGSNPGGTTILLRLIVVVGCGKSSAQS